MMENKILFSIVKTSSSSGFTLCNVTHWKPRKKRRSASADGVSFHNTGGFSFAVLFQKTSGHGNYCLSSPSTRRYYLQLVRCHYLPLFMISTATTSIKSRGPVTMLFLVRVAHRRANKIGGIVRGHQRGIGWLGWSRREEKEDIYIHLWFGIDFSVRKWRTK